LELGQAVAHLRGHGEVVLAFVAFERLGERGFGLVSLAGGVQHLGEVAKRVSLVVEPVRSLDERDRFARERFRLRVLAATSILAIERSGRA
jgi:hypothetical protein